MPRIQEKPSQDLKILPQNRDKIFRGQENAPQIWVKEFRPRRNMHRFWGNIFRSRENIPQIWVKEFQPRKNMPEFWGKMFRPQENMPQIWVKKFQPRKNMPEFWGKMFRPQEYLLPVFRLVFKLKNCSVPDSRHIIPALETIYTETMHRNCVQ